MRWLALVLLAANLALGGYFSFLAPRPRGQADIAALELNAERVKIVRSAAARPAAADTVKPKLGACLEWGLFADADLERAQAELAKAEIRNVRTRELEPAPAWLVYIAPLRSRDDADARVRELEDSQVKGARVLTDERFRNAVSLGVFASEAAAKAQVQRMRDAKVRNVAMAQRNEGVRLSMLTIADATPALAGRLAELRTSIAGTEVKAVACPSNGG